MNWLGAGMKVKFIEKLSEKLNQQLVWNYNKQRNLWQITEIKMENLN